MTAAAAPIPPQPASAPATEAETITAYKGFDQNLQCRGFQFEVGKTYEHQGKVAACESGFHAIAGNPLETFGYYPPGTSRYTDVTQGGVIARHSEDSKVASARITIGAEIKLPDFIARAVAWLIANATDKGQHVTGDRSAASSTGYESAASSTGDRSAASSTGYESAASSTGDRSAASSTGYESAAASFGYDGRVMAEKNGCALFLVERNDRYDIIATWSGITGRDGVKAGAWYTLKNGKPVEA